MEKEDKTGQKLPKYSKKSKNTGQKSRKYQLWKWKYTKYNHILLKNDLKYKHINVRYIMVVISNCIRYALLGT